MKKVFIMIGCPGSGKSTYVAKRNLPWVSRDQIRIDLGYCGKDEKYLGTREEENKVTEEHQRIMRTYISEGKDFMVDDTNVNQKFRKELILMLRESGYNIVGVRMKTGLNTCILRRPDIPDFVIKSMYQKSKEVSAAEFDEFLEIRGE